LSHDLPRVLYDQAENRGHLITNQKLKDILQ
jgi:hypothetical protein